MLRNLMSATLEETFSDPLFPRWFLGSLPVAKMEGSEFVSNRLSPGPGAALLSKPHGAAGDGAKLRRAAAGCGRLRLCGRPGEGEGTSEPRKGCKGKAAASLS